MNNYENFDSSLVPVSSIVTLAKNVSNIVDNNGTLINPGNIQINNLDVLGTTTLNKTNIIGTLSTNNPASFNSLTNTTKGNINNIKTNTLNIKPSATDAELIINGKTTVDSKLDVTEDTTSKLLNVNGDISSKKLNTINANITGKLSTTNNSTFANTTINKSLTLNKAKIEKYSGVNTNLSNRVTLAPINNDCIFKIWMKSNLCRLVNNSDDSINCNGKLVNGTYYSNHFAKFNGIIRVNPFYFQKNSEYEISGYRPEIFCRVNPSNNKLEIQAESNYTVTNFTWGLTVEYI